MKLGILFESVVVRSALLVSAALFWLAGCDSSYWAPGPGGDYVGAVGEPLAKRPESGRTRFRVVELMFPLPVTS